MEEELKAGLQDKKEDFIVLTPMFLGDPDLMVQALDLVKRSDLQTQVMLAFIQYARPHHEISRKALAQHVDVTGMVLKALEKGNLQSRKEIYRSGYFFIPWISISAAFNGSGKSYWNDQCFIRARKTGLLYYMVWRGGKTRVYSEFIKDVVSTGRQVLYLLPEIALTTYLIEKLQEKSRK